MMARRTMTTTFCGAFWGLAATAGLAPDFGETTVQSVTAGEPADLTTPPAACDKAAFWVNEKSVVVTGAVASAGGRGVRLPVV